MKRHYLLFLALLPLIGWAHEDTLRLSLDDCITMARRQSIDAAVALGELRSAYWQWRSYRADLLPEVSLSGTAPSWNKRYSSYQQADGSLSFVRNDYLGLDGAVNITQKLWPTGGTLSVESSLDYLHQSGSGGSGNQFMSLPVAVTLSQPLFSVNHLKWNRRIEPLRYREAQARFLTETEQVAMQAISLYFGLLLAGEQVNIARQNLQTAEKLYEVAQAKRRMGTISENDVLQLRLDVLTARSALTNSESTARSSMWKPPSPPPFPKRRPWVSISTTRTSSPTPFRTTPLLPPCAAARWRPTTPWPRPAPIARASTSTPNSDTPVRATT